jgi:hypothetical protein
MKPIEHLETMEPTLKKKVYSYNVNKTMDDDLDFDPMDLKSKSGNTDPLRHNKFYTEASEIIHERRSEEMCSESVDSESIPDPKMNTLYIPPVNTEAQRKRVSSFKKIDDMDDDDSDPE